MRAEKASDIETPAHAADPDREVMDLRERVDISLGLQLAAAREDRNWTRADVAHRLRLPLKVVERLEGDDYQALSDGVFLRGYLASYARLVGVPVDQARRVAAENSKPSPLVATGTISRTRYLVERYSVSATYLALTAIIVVPAVWVATHGGLNQSLVRTTPLDPPARIVAIGVDGTPDTSAPLDDGAQASGSPQVQARAIDPSPVIASMAPFTSAAAPLPSVPVPAPVSADHRVHLRLAQQSWVEITTADGRKLEYGMLAAGSEHDYRSDSAVSVRLGNAQGAEVTVDGSNVDLLPFQRANVAHFRLQPDDGTMRASRVEQ